MCFSITVLPQLSPFLYSRSWNTSFIKADRLPSEYLAKEVSKKGFFSGKWIFNLNRCCLKGYHLNDWHAVTKYLKEPLMIRSKEADLLKGSIYNAHCKNRTQSLWQAILSLLKNQKTTTTPSHSPCFITQVPATKSPSVFWGFFFSYQQEHQVMYSP